MECRSCNTTLPWSQLADGDGHLADGLLDCFFILMNCLYCNCLIFWGFLSCKLLDKSLIRKLDVKRLGP